MNYTDSTVYDLTIIGGGPTGLFSAFYGGLRGRSVKVIDSIPQLGGQVAALYPEKYIYDVAGFPKVKGDELIQRLVQQLKHFPPSIVLEEEVQAFEKREEYFVLQTNKGTHLSKAIIITGGIGSFSPRKLGLDKASIYEGENLHYAIRDLNAFRNKRVLIAGGGDSALDWALMLEEVAKEVYLVHRRSTFRAHESSEKLLRESTVQVYTPHVISDLIGNERIEQVVLEDQQTGTENTLDVDDVMVNFGFISSLGPIKNWGLDLEKRKIKVNSKMETSIPGIYAAGDIVTYPGKVDLIAVGFGEAPTAVNNALAYIDPKIRIQPAHSSNLSLGD